MIRNGNKKTPGEDAAGKTLELLNKISSNPELLKKIEKLVSSEDTSAKSTNEMNEPIPHKSIKSKGKAKRPLEEEEYNKIISSIYNGFHYFENGENHYFNPNPKVGLALVIEATTGLRISDIIKLKVKSFKGGKMELNEKKTGKLQYRKINTNLVSVIYSYAFENGLGEEDLLINCTERNIQLALKKAVDRLGYQNIGTHSFRKYFSSYVYKNTKDIQLLQQLLNHSSILTTQRYLGMDQEKLDKASSSVDFTSIVTNQP